MYRIWYDRFRILAPTSKVQIFSTFMFSKYLEEGFETASRYTHGMRIWEMDCVIIPIHTGNHWLVLIIVNPGGLLKLDDDA